MARSAGVLALFVAVGAGGAAAAQAPERSVARRWNELLLESIRRDTPRPPVHSRNLFHFSAAMWDAWATFDARAQPWLLPERHAAPDPAAARREAVSHAAYRMLLGRFSASPGFAVMGPRYAALMNELGYDPTNASTVGDTPAAIGNRIASTIISACLNDGANQLQNYANAFYQPVNPPLVVPLAGNPGMLDIRRFQPISLSYSIGPGGAVIPGSSPAFLGAEWGGVMPFASTANDRSERVRAGRTWFVYDDPGAPPEIGGEGDGLWRRGHEMVAAWSGHLDPADGVMWDVSPRSMGNNPSEPATDLEAQYRFLDGGDVGPGYAFNPVTGQPYAPQFVRRGDFVRVLAEYWADGPNSETPPGHWFAILNAVLDHPGSHRRIGGVGRELDPLEYDIKAYLALGGALHDTAVSVWSIKGWYDAARPISAIRRMCTLGQSSDASLPSYHPNGIGLVPGAIELITSATTAPGARHAHLAGNEGRIAIRSWRGAGAISNPATDVAGVGWVLGEAWMPYQRPTFVTPPFGGYVSGHSAFSRAAAHVLTRLTGSRYFPGGLGEFRAVAGNYLVFEDGPSADVVLQFASYFDAADQAGLSRIWGGIHPPFDDLPARRVGDRSGPRAFDRARLLWMASACFGDVSGDAQVNGIDLGDLLAQWGSSGDADLDGSGQVDGVDLGLMMSAWGACP